MSYYDNSQWPPATGQATWDHQTPPARSGASSAVPRDEPTAFVHQLDEVDRAIDNLMKSGKMFGASGGRPARGMTGGASSRPHSIGDFGDARGPHPSGNLQNFYAAQRHQSSRGSNEAEQMMQAKRRMAAQRERELRNYHQEQQYNRTVLTDHSVYGNKADRALSPNSNNNSNSSNSNNMSEEERRELIARQHSALYGDASFADAAGYVNETGASRPGMPGSQNGPGASLRGHSPMGYEYGRSPPVHPDAGGSQTEVVQGSQSAAANERSRANSNASPQSNPTGSKGVFDAPVQQSSRTSASSPGGSPPRQGAPGSKPGQGTVAPIGTRPSVSNAPGNSSLNKRSTTPLPSPLSQGYTAPGEEGNTATSAAPSNPATSAAEGNNVGLAGWGSRSGVWGSKSGLGVQASVWG